MIESPEDRHPRSDKDQRLTSILISESGQKFSYTCYAETQDEADCKALQRIQEVGWDNYGYKIFNYGD